MSQFNPANHHPVLIEALCLHSIYLTLKFTSDEIFSEIRPNGFCVTVKKNGKEASIRIGANPPGSPTDTMLAWKNLLAEWNTGGCMTADDKNRLVDQSKSRQMAVIIVTALVSQGLMSE